jgi:hypothetical protein
MVKQVMNKAGIMGVIITVAIIAGVMFAIDMQSSSTQQFATTPDEKPHKQTQDIITIPVEEVYEQTHNFTTTFTNETQDVTPNVTIIENVPTPPPVEEEKYNTSLYPEDLEAFQRWADEHDVFLEGINKDSNHLYYSGYNPTTDKVELDSVLGILIAAEALYKIPDNVLQTMAGKTFYFSTQSGRSYTVLASFPDQNILAELNRGIIIEQGVTAHTTIHEFGHIVDYHGIQGIYEDDQSIFIDLKEKRDEIFKVAVDYDPSSVNVPQGYISVYSTANDAENFAEHFAYYALYPDEFKDKMKNDSLLAEKYSFLRDFIFDGIEY